MSSQPSVFVVDPDQSASDLVRRLCDEMGVRSASFQTADVFLAAYQGNRPACVVAEFRLRGMNGIELQESLVADCRALPFVFVTADPETRLIVRAMRNGAITVLEKPLSHQEVWDAINQALTIEQKMHRIDARHSEVRRRLSSLTQNERLVLDMMIEGKTNKWIARKLEVSVRTIESRRHQVFRKTKTESVAELVRFYLSVGSEEE
jgi:FixJ family two-component response regulator